MKLKVTHVLVLLLLISSTLLSQQSEKTKLLILGTPHLVQIKEFKPEYLTVILDSLNKYKFDAVAIEKMPADLLLDIRNRYGNHWRDLYEASKSEIEFGEMFQQVIGLSYKDALGNLAGIRSKVYISDEDRVKYINSYLCIYDSWSACLHFKKLKNDTLLNPIAFNYLKKLSNSNNEINTIGLAVAQNRNLRQIYYIDNFQDETILLNEFPSFEEEYQNHSRKIEAHIKESKLFEKQDSLQIQCLKGGNLFPLYKYYNSTDFMNNDIYTQWSLWFKTNFKSYSDRSRYSLWEMRNLQIAANILRVVATHPTKRILVVIGASHKAFLEKYLSQVPDIELLKF
ncbi:MAG: hypothetical protein J0L83_03605 [Chitinophagales bacterium]|nr:hypothetical protein [Chitinophagales bacterium]